MSDNCPTKQTQRNFMNSKSVVFAVFAIWSVICWRWYVCGLMDACGDNASRLSDEEVLAIPDYEKDTATIVQTPEIQPLDRKNTNSKFSKPVSPSNMNEVQMEEIDDRMVIHFPYNSTRKEDNDAIDEYLGSLASVLISSGENVTVTGHADFVGESSYNYSLGLRRVYGIRDILIKKGVSKSQIKCKSFGDRKPISTNDTPYGRYLNRRAEIRVGK